MSGARTMKVPVLLIVVMSMISMPLFAGLEEKMNKEIKIELNDVTITEALKKISDEIDVPIQISDEAEWKLPYGKSTRLSVTLEGPASEAITQMLNEFFMRYALGQDEIVIYPRPELDHVIGRPSARQLNILKAVYTKPIELYITDNVSATVNTALDQEVFISPIDLHDNINGALRSLAGEKRIKTGIHPGSKKNVYESKLPLDADGNESQDYMLPTSVTLPQLLRDISTNRGLGTDWYIPAIDLPNQVPEIRIIESGELYRFKRGQLIDVSYEDKALLEILQSLADRGSIYYEKNPHAIQYLQERFTVSMQNVTAMQAMKKIADMAQLDYQADGYEFHLRGKIKPPQPKTRSPQAKSRTTKTTSSSTDRGQYVGKISIPMEDGKYYIEYMLRESDLTDELKKLRSEKIAEIIGKQPKEKLPLAPAAQPVQPK